MTSGSSLEKQLTTLREESVKTNKKLLQLERNQVLLKKRIKELEVNTNAIEHDSAEEETVSESSSSTPVLGIIFLVIGALLSWTIIGAIIGVPLIIAGIILIIVKVNKNAKVAQAKEKQISKEDTVSKSSTIEENIGMKWFARIGILALVIGVGFFIKYAIEMNWINHQTRIILGVLFGIALIIIGDIVSKKDIYNLWGKTVVGGGFIFLLIRQLRVWVN